MQMINVFYAKEYTMDLRSLSTFIQIAELGNFTRAADKLGYSQPTVSFQIKQLEQELGIKLFDRVGHTVSLTEDGKAALAYAQKICRMAQEMTQGASKNFEPTGIVRIAMADSLCAPLVLEKFAKFRSLYPNIVIKITTAGTSEMFRLLDHNEVDIVCTLDARIYSTTYIVQNEEKINAHFVCSTNHPLAKKNALSIDELLREPFLLTEKGMSYRRLLDERLARDSKEIQPVFEVGSADIICELVKENTGVSFLPDYVTEHFVANGSIVRIPIRNFEIELWKQILYHKDKWVTPQMQAVIKYLADISLAPNT
jgi:DNA-binding transcriptional LysR family regulator